MSCLDVYISSCILVAVYGLAVSCLTVSSSIAYRFAVSCLYFIELNCALLDVFCLAEYLLAVSYLVVSQFTVSCLTGS